MCGGDRSDSFVLGGGGRCFALSVIANTTTTISPQLDVCKRISRIKMRRCAWPDADSTVSFLRVNKRSSPREKSRRVARREDARAAREIRPSPLFITFTAPPTREWRGVCERRTTRLSLLQPLGAYFPRDERDEESETWKRTRMRGGTKVVTAVPVPIFTPALRVASTQHFSFRGVSQSS